MDLVNMKRVTFRCTILDRPILDGSLRRHDCRWIIGIESDGSLTVDGDIEDDVRIKIVRIQRNFGEIYRSLLKQCTIFHLYPRFYF